MSRSQPCMMAAEVLLLVAYYDSSLGAQIYLNTGWSSAFNRESEKILTQEAEIVLAHELGMSMATSSVLLSTRAHLLTTKF